MNLRTDDWRLAGWKRAHEIAGCDYTAEQIADAQHAEESLAAGKTVVLVHDPRRADVGPAQIGDVWRITGPDGEHTGYALTCPLESCDQGAHDWTHAFDCTYWQTKPRVCKQGPDRTSCWDWTGSPETGDLTAAPSLWCVAERGGCGFHGWLKNGVLA